MTPEEKDQQHLKEERKRYRLKPGQHLPAEEAEEPKGFYLEPLPGCLVAIEDPFKYEGRIIIPGQAQRRPTTGKVVAIGEGVTKITVGDHVVWPMLSGTLIKFRGHPDYHIFNEDEILAKIIGEAELEEMTV